VAYFVNEDKDKRKEHTETLRNYNSVGNKKMPVVDLGDVILSNRSHIRHSKYFELLFMSLLKIEFQMDRSMYIDPV